MMQFWRSFTSHANVMEMVQAAVAFTGMSFSIWALVDAIKDSMALTMSGANGPRRIIAMGSVWTEVERTIIHFSLFVIGFASILLPPPYTSAEAVPSAEVLQHTITRSGLVFITVFKVIGALRARYERTLFVRKMSLIGKNPKTPPVFLAPPPGRTINGNDLPEIEDRRDLRKDSTKESTGAKREGE